MLTLISLSNGWLVIDNSGYKLLSVIEGDNLILETPSAYRQRIEVGNTVAYIIQ